MSDDATDETGELAALRAEIASIEARRFALVTAGIDTVKAHVALLKLEIAIASHSGAVCRALADSNGEAQYSRIVRDHTAEVHKLQRDLIRDELEALAAMAMQQTNAASVLRGYLP